jgi:glucosamine-6-phosphate deaminase
MDAKKHLRVVTGPYTRKEQFGRLTLIRSEKRADMAEIAAIDIAEAIRRHLRDKPKIRMIFAAAPSQEDMLAALIHQPDIDWSRVQAFHMDDYVGLPPDAPQGFGNWLKSRLFEKVPFEEVRLIDTSATPEESVRSYEALLSEASIDIICLGIGANGHLAFNDPVVSEFDEPSDVKIVPLDEINRRQQVSDGCFETLEDVPKIAITLTVPMLMSAEELFCVVPGEIKRQAVWRTLHEPISTSCPSTILRTHKNCRFYIDGQSDPGM